MRTDQHFMTDLNVISRIISAARIEPQDTVLEIGAGSGLLTRELAKRAKTVIAIEIDSGLEERLRDNLRGIGNVELVFGSALDMLKKGGTKFDRIVSNTPYSISEPLVQELVYLDFESAVLALPRQFAWRLKARPGDRGFTRLSIIAGEFFEIDILFDIPKESLSPMPKTPSVAISLKPKDRKSLFCRVVLRRKMKLKNAIMRGLFETRKYTKNQARKTIKSLKINNLLDKKLSEMDTGELKTVWQKLQKT